MFAINHLHIKADKKEAKAVVSDLQYGSWSVVDNQEWLFIRSLNIRSKKNTLRQQASEETNKAIQQAVDGRLAGASGANAVRFQSYPELLAFLLRDLSNGSAASLWYWSRWQYLFSETNSQAVQRLLWESREHLGEVIQQLIHYQLLSTVWVHVSKNASSVVLQALVQNLPQLETAIFADLKSQDEQQGLQSIKTSLLNNLRTMRCWQQALNGIDPQDERCQLAAITTGLQYCPVLTQRYPNLVIISFCQILESLAESLKQKQKQKNKIAEENQTPERLVAPQQGEQQERLKIVERQATKLSEKHQGENITDKHIEKARVDSKEKKGNIIENNFDERKDSNLTAENLSNSKSPAQKIQSLSNQTTAKTNDKDFKEAELPQTPAPHFITEYGGIFYLINAIRDETCQQLLRSEPAHSVVSGWLWLYQLAKGLGAEPDTSLSHFIAEQCGFDSPQQLQAQPVLPSIELVQQRLAARYQQGDFWNSELLKIPAQVVATASHIDVYFPLNRVDLSVRLAGLDINPGWIPWLGRVVSFHYLQQDITLEKSGE